MTCPHPDGPVTCSPCVPDCPYRRSARAKRAVRDGRITETRDEFDAEDEWRREEGTATGTPQKG